MTTKTLTVTENAYHLLRQNKRVEESFSEEIVRFFSVKKTKTLRDFFGVLPRKAAELMNEDLRRMKEAEIEMLRRRI